MGLVKRVTKDRVSDEEELYRSVRGNLEDEEYSYDPTTGHLILRPQAFKDREKEPSVDRAKLRNFDPEKSRIGEKDGIVTLITQNTQKVRQMGDVVTNGKDGRKINHAIDVSAAPTPENEAHAQIVVMPNFFGSENKKNKTFKLLRKALARLATQSGWTLEPKNS